MANDEHLTIIEKSVLEWNRWRKQNPNIEVDLEEADLSGLNLEEANLNNVNLRDANLQEAFLVRADLQGAQLSGADLSGADLSEANLKEVDLMEADLRQSILTRANLQRADLVRANLMDANLHFANLQEVSLQESRMIGANLNGAFLERASLSRVNLSGASLQKANLTCANLTNSDLYNADLSYADLSYADLSRCSIIDTNFKEATLQGCRIYGISAWDLKLENTKQAGLIITRSGQSEIIVDDLEVAQFIYLLLNNQKIKNVINTIISKVVLILGRFSVERKQVLDGLRRTLHSYGFVPVIFDFKPSQNRDLSETIHTLASMARFVIADLTDAKSIPQELTIIVPNLPSVPIQPIILSGQKEYAMFEHWKHYAWVCPIFEYNDEQMLLHNLEKVIQPALTIKDKQKTVEALTQEIIELKKQLGSR